MQICFQLLWKHGSTHEPGCADVLGPAEHQHEHSEVGEVVHHLGPSRSDWQSFLFRDSPPLGGSGVFPPPELIFSKYQHLETETRERDRL